MSGSTLLIMPHLEGCGPPLFVGADGGRAVLGDVVIPRVVLRCMKIAQVASKDSDGVELARKLSAIPKSMHHRECRSML